MDIDDRYLQNEQACAKSVKEHTLPFKNGTLEWISDDGKKTGTVVLGHRMKKLQKITDAEEAELTRQYIEWLEVQAEIDAIAAEIAGPDHIPDQSATGRLSKTDVLVAEQMELQREITEEKAKFLKMMDEAAAFSKKALIESEQVRGLCRSTSDQFAEQFIPRSWISDSRKSRTHSCLYCVKRPTHCKEGRGRELRVKGRSQVYLVLKNKAPTYG